MVLVSSTMLPLGTPAPDFRLSDPDGSLVARADFTGMPLLVVFTCNHCPFVKHLADEFSSFAREYTARGLGIVAINSNDIDAYPEDAPDKMKEEIVARGYEFPYLIDETQEVARSYRAACTPDFFLFDADHRLVYRGRFDDTRPAQEPPQVPHGHDLRNAAEAVLKGAPPLGEQLPSAGCNIKWRPHNAPEYFEG